ncbi:MAG: glycosyltransferase [Deltaproteobacteria bacterium]|nr:glycosyltransferase [Deltaproteobacteria bacterium]
MSALLALWLAITLLSWALLLAGGAWDKGWRLGPGAAEGQVRVVVPARDEVENIGACVRAVLASEHQGLRLVVVDDDSRDGTGAAALAAGGGDPRLELRRAGPRPEGWSGKAWAVQQGADDAACPWLLFLDADVRLDPGALGAMLARAEADGAELLSLFGSWELVGLWERVVIPAIGWFIRGAQDLDALNGEGASRPAFANGQVILVRTEAWRAWGGHGAVRGEVLDDVRLAQVARAAGGRLRLLHAPWAFRVRLYRSLGEIVQGYRKNLYEGMGRRPALALIAAALVGLTSVLPWVALPLLLWRGPGWGSAGALLAVGMMTLFRWRIERQDGRSGLIAPLHGLGALVLLGVLLASMAGGRVRWKGRAFVGGRTAE